jgi:protein ImuB
MKVASVLIPVSVPARPAGPAAGDSVEAAELTERLVRRLEGIGAEVESERPGEAFFAVDGLRGIHGGDAAGVAAAARLAAAMPALIGVAPTRFAAFVAASGGDPHSETIVPAAGLRELLSSLPVSSLTGRLGLSERDAADLAEALGRLGIGTLGALAALSPGHVADRFGPVGLRALRVARGGDEPLRPRQPHVELAAEVELPEGTAGDRLERALELLIDRLLAAPQRGGRTLLGLRLAALLSDGGSWSVDQGLGRPSAQARVLRTVLAPRLAELPAPAIALRLRAVGLGPPAADQLELAVEGDESRRRRLGAALREVRAAQGLDSLLRVLPTDAASRVPERRATLTPYPPPSR